MSAPRRLLALVDVLDADGHTRHSHPVHAGDDGQACLRLGRSLDNELVLDDAHLAPVHAELRLGSAPEGALTLLPSLNGAQHGRHHVAAPGALHWPHDGVVQLGQTKLRLRHAAGVLAPELALGPAHRPQVRRSWVVLMVLAVFVLGTVGFDTWLHQSPGEGWRPVGVMLLSLAVGVAGWAAVWALMGQVFQRRFPFLQHLRWTLTALSLVWCLENLLPGLAYALSLPALQAVSTVAIGAVFTGLVYVQGRHVWPRAAGRWLALLLAGAAVTGVITLWQREQQQHWIRPLYLSALPPPALRLAPLRSTDALLQDAAALREELARKAAMDPVTGEPADEEE